MSQSLAAEVVEPFDFIRRERAVVDADIVDEAVEFICRQDLFQRCRDRVQILSPRCSILISMSVKNISPCPVMPVTLSCFAFFKSIPTSSAISKLNKE